MITVLSMPSSNHAVFTDDSEQSNTSVESEDEDLIKLKKAIQEHLAKEDKFKVIILFYSLKTFTPSCNDKKKGFPISLQFN